MGMTIVQKQYERLALSKLSTFIGAMESGGTETAGDVLQSVKNYIAEQNRQLK